MKIEIKSRYDSSVLLTVETGSLGLAVESAVKSGADLSGADLSGADLSGADLSGADLSGADLSGADLSRAYKLVTEAGAGPFNGGIIYTVGHEHAVSDANGDPTIQCAAGINLATLDWCMREWKPGYRILVAEFTAADIAAIPTATDGKFRVRRCRIVGEKNLAEIGLC